MKSYLVILVLLVSGCGSFPLIDGKYSCVSNCELCDIQDLVIDQHGESLVVSGPITLESGHLNEDGSFVIGDGKDNFDCEGIMEDKTLKMSCVRNNVSCEDIQMHKVVF